MSSCNPTRRGFCLALVLAAPLSACGFTPVYGPETAATQLQGTIEYQEPRESDQFDIARRVEQRVGVASNPRFLLVILPRISTEALAVAAEEDITRFDFIGDADFILSDLQTGEALLQGQVSTITSFSATGNTVTTLAAQRAAKSRLMVALTDLVLTRIIASADALPL